MVTMKDKDTAVITLPYTEISEIYEAADTMLALMIANDNDGFRFAPLLALLQAMLPDKADAELLQSIKSGYKKVVDVPRR